MRDAKLVQFKQSLQLVNVLLITEHFEDPVVAEPRWHTGCAPLIDSFTGEQPDVLLDNWLTSLEEQPPTWNEWTEVKWQLQFAGHLQRRHCKNGA